MATTQVRSGWVTFTGLLTGIVAVYNILSGIAAIAEDDVTEQVGEVLYGINITAWGWFWLILGIVQLVTAGLSIARNPIGQMLGLLWAFIGASLSVFTIFVTPYWSLVVLGHQPRRHLGADGAHRGLRRVIQLRRDRCRRRRRTTRGRRAGHGQQRPSGAATGRPGRPVAAPRPGRRGQPRTWPAARATRAATSTPRRRATTSLSSSAPRTSRRWSTGSPASRRGAPGPRRWRAYTCRGGPPSPGSGPAGSARPSAASRSSARYTSWRGTRHTVPSSASGASSAGDVVAVAGPLDQAGEHRPLVQRQRLAALHATPSHGRDRPRPPPGDSN